ncbi:hypothetical protein ACEZCY_14710 [Streptacidiphilus sp. N1-12]|uniref:Uncharacterized protein n=2 Tax=Streptacidiphilus alkalitolerans TaxID=3342712 RepID=A0ABV6WEN9_9ACTN
MTLIYVAGQDVGLTTTVISDSGVPASGTPTVVLTVTDPTGTVTTLATLQVGQGAYAAVVPAVATPGVWQYRWTATGTGVGFADEGQFQVRPLGTQQIVDLASVKAHLNMPPGDSSQDAELQGFILAAGDVARNIVGPVVAESHTQYFSGGTPTVVVDWTPLASVQSVTEYYGQSGYVLTEQPLGAQTTAFAFTVDYDTGQISRRTFGGEAARFAIGDKNIKVMYTAGRGGAVGWAVRLGTLELIRHLWQLTQQGGRPRLTRGGLDSDSPGIPTGFAIPTRVLELWQGDKRPPGIA